MHMQDGIGRNGYRWLGSVFFGIGLLGLLTTWYAFNQAKQDAGLYDWLGFCLTAVALIALYATMLVLLSRSSEPVAFKAARPEANQVPGPQPAQPAPVRVPEARPDNDPNIEFDDAVAVQGPETLVPVVGEPRPGREPMPRREAPSPRAPIAPPPRAAPILPPNRNVGMDTKGWPQRRGPSGITRREMMEQLRSREDDAPVPTILAKPANGLARNDGTSRGKCGGCGASLLAPSQRPVNIKCPRCDKVTLIQ